MALQKNTIINHYKIVSLIGVGGMGEVYKAEDTKLDRPVALKILPAHLVEDPDRVRRFIQEAKSASALNHPHIVTIYEIGQVSAEEMAQSEGAQDSSSAGTAHYIAMEFIDGETLHQKIHRRDADLKKNLEYLAQAADGLSKAHSAGIVHRDLKPENIMITEDGYAKILDFGLAKLVEAKESDAAPQSSKELEEAATAMMSHTRPGMVMGTLGYMSPEQVQGKPVDQRSDIFSFGCILYEAATGIKPFTGDSMIDSLHKIVYAQVPPIKDVNPGAPVELQRIARKCLSKAPEERYQSTKDVAIDLRELIREYNSFPPVTGALAGTQASAAYAQSQSTGPHSQPPVTGAQEQQSFQTGPQAALATDSGQAPAPATKTREGRWIVYGAGLAVVLIAALALLYFFVIQKKGKDAARSGQKLATLAPFQNPKLTKLTTSGKSIGAVISPDGKFVAHIVNENGQLGLLVRNLATSTNDTKLPPANVTFRGLSFSPDSNYIYYVSGEKDNPLSTLYQVPVFGNTPPKKVLEDVDSSVSFSPDGKRMAFIRGYVQEKETAIIIINADGTGEQKLAVRKNPAAFLDVKWSPDGSVIACPIRSFDGGMHTQLAAFSVADGSEKQIGPRRWQFIAGLSWLSDSSGLVISARELGLASIQFHLWQIAYPDGEAKKITNDLVSYGGVSLSSDSSALVTIENDALSNLWSLPNGDTNSARQLTTGSGQNMHIKWTPDGKLVYVSDAGGTLDLWIMDGDGKNQKQITSDANVEIMPAVSPDGRYIVFTSNRGDNSSAMNLWRIDIDGSNARQITTGETDYWPSFSADGNWIFYNHIVAGERPVLWKVPINGGEAVKMTEQFSLQSRVSPDGKFIATWHSAAATERPKIAILPMDGGPPVKLLNISLPPNFSEFVNFCWTSDGKGIAYLDMRDGLINVWVQPVSGGEPKQVTDFKSDTIFNFDWSRDGKHLAVSRGIATTDVILIKAQPKAESDK